MFSFVLFTCYIENKSEDILLFTCYIENKSEDILLFMYVILRTNQKIFYSQLENVKPYSDYYYIKTI